MEQSTQPESYSDAAKNDDWTLASALQLMEFEIIEETRRDNGDFDEKEYRASSYKRQLLTLSTFVCIIQVRNYHHVNILLLFMAASMSDIFIYY